MSTPSKAQDQGRRLQALLGTRLPPIAISFLDEVPAGVPARTTAAPASCSHWLDAASGEVFSTNAADHQGCPIGAHTHGVALSSDKAAELNGMIGNMVQLGYLRMEEVPQIPHRAPGTFRHAVYSPLAKAPAQAEVVLVRGTSRQLMLLAEAAQLAGLAGALPTMGRPTCAVLPLVQQSGKLAHSLGCIGNRVYTGLADDEAYLAIPGAALDALLAQLEIVAKANTALEEFHRARAASA